MEAVAAHGGLDRWRTLGGVAAHLHADGPYYPREADYLFDPARNRAVARFRDKHGHAVEWRYDAKHGTILEDGRCVGSAKQRAKVGGLLSNLLFWLGVPFKCVDEGATQRGVDADRYLVTYAGVGDTPRDWYLVTLAADRRVHDAIYVGLGVHDRDRIPQRVGRVARRRRLSRRDAPARRAEERLLAGAGAAHRLRHERRAHWPAAR